MSSSSWTFSIPTESCRDSSRANSRNSASSKVTPFCGSFFAIDDERAEGAAPAAERGDDPGASQLGAVEAKAPGRVMGGVVDHDTRAQRLPFGGRGRQHQLTVPAVVEPDFDGARSQDVPDFRRQGLEGGVQAQAGRDSPRKQQQKLAQPLVDADFPFEPVSLTGRV